MNFVDRFKDRTGGVIASVIASIIFCCCGAVMAFYLSPRQALEANRISRLPQMDAVYVFNADPGDDLLVSGKLVDNVLQFDDAEFVAYKQESWDVTVSTDDDGNKTTSGKWTEVELVSPLLALQVSGEVLDVLASEDVIFSGSQHEDILTGEGPEFAKDGSEDVADGTLRYLGFYNGDIVTVLGVRASSGGIVPDILFGGDRVEFEEDQVEAAQGFLIGGITMLACAPIILIGGSFAALFSRRRRKLF